MTELFPELATAPETVDFRPARAEGLKRLEQFAGRTGQHYARTRNYDFGTERRSNVSALSPWLRHRLVTEEEVLARVLASHSPSAAEKFVQEVFWRTYFKGWLEQRPSVWTHYQRDLMGALETLECDTSLASRHTDAVSGNTDIDCFDHWAKELVATGYLHNHARMWFASIWIFTLRLPWQLGADFLLRHLIDGDPASNTLSWRWVAGLHTKGKTYLARPDNIAKYTDGRFHPTGLAKFAEPLTEPILHERVPLLISETHLREPFVLLLTEDDLSGAAIMPTPPAAVMGLLATYGRSPKPVGSAAENFAKDAINSALPSSETRAQSADDWSTPMIEAAQTVGVKTVATAYAAVGPVRSRLDRAEPILRQEGITLERITRPYDTISWPHAKAGFFDLKKKIPTILCRLDLSAATK